MSSWIPPHPELSCLPEDEVSISESGSHRELARRTVKGCMDSTLRAHVLLRCFPARRLDKRCPRNQTGVRGVSCSFSRQQLCHHIFVNEPKTRYNGRRTA
jgi:hypothetical protein